MRMTILTIGKLRAGPFKDLCEMYLNRMTWSVAIEEIEGSGARSRGEQRTQETKALLARIPSGGRPIFLEPGGKMFSSPEFATWIEKLGTENQRPLFVIGGSEGIETSLWKAPSFSLSLGLATWPHLLARVMMIEQIYRAHEILAGKRYHK
jgi:23S rRNA (pseudouridine1915-N3)-methyltransferase